MSEEQATGQAPGAEDAPTPAPLPDEIRVPLSEPLKHGKQELTTIILARPRVKHLRAMDKYPGEVSKQVAMMAAMSGLPMNVIDELSTDDFAEVTLRGEPFFAKLQRLAPKR